MKSQAVRQSFLEFFRERGHRVVPSAPLVPHGDATLLFTNAGMVQFKDFFTGAASPPDPRAASAQKCLRVSGKHNDLENVGPSPRHHTFFEMLGNFSFGDYFKAEAIEFAWDLVTRVWGLDPAVLSATVYEEDDDAEALWRKISGLPAGRIHRCGKKDNFWAMGDTGPCGPCSEIFVDLEPRVPAVDWDAGTESGRYLEIWNLVFMQFERAADGSMRPLPSPSIDTGAGLERVTAVLQGAASNYDTDLFRPILDAAAELAAVRYGAAAEKDVSLRVVADHLRAVAFLLADGVIPSNDGRGYVLRRILRRAVRHGMRLGFAEPFLHRLLPVLGEGMSEAYPELIATRATSQATVRTEEEKFLATVAQASKLVQDAIEEAKRRGGNELPGDAVFRFYDTNGLPLELIREIAEEERFGVDLEGFEKALGEQRKRSRGAGKLPAGFSLVIQDETVPPTEFLGYEALNVDGAAVTHVVGPTRSEFGPAIGPVELAAGAEGQAVLDRTPFYAEGGGQVGDRGSMTWPQGRATVLNTQKNTAGVIFHRVRVESGQLADGQVVSLEVAEASRRATERNHTATHLLHAALHRVVGAGALQKGSLVAPDRLRFDFTHGQPLTVDERSQVEDLVNGWIRDALPTEIAVRAYDDALAAGAMALFGEKYGDRVRTVSVPGVSLELCGGCHVRNTGEIGSFLVTSERGVASGVRRIEAVTGGGALELVRGRERLLAEVEAALGVPPERAADEIAALKERLRSRERELQKLRLENVTGGGTDGGGTGASGSTLVAGVRLLVREVPAAPPDELRAMADALRDKLGSGVVVLAGRGDGKVSLIATVTKDLTGRIRAGDLVRRIAPLVGGTGGGRPDFAQAGGKEPEKLEGALAAVPALVTELLGAAGA